MKVYGVFLLGPGDQDKLWQQTFSDLLAADDYVVASRLRNPGAEYVVHEVETPKDWGTKNKIVNVSEGLMNTYISWIKNPTGAFLCFTALASDGSQIEIHLPAVRIKE